MSSSSQQGKVVLAGAGPGDPSLITVAALESLRVADVVVYDSLVSSELLREARSDAELIFAGKRAGTHQMPQEEINAVLVKRAAAGNLVLRLKGGDPFVFGRGGEEASALEEAGVRFEIIPGITAATAASLYAGIPMTDRRYSATLTFATGHTASAASDDAVNWQALADLGGTLVFYMGVRSMGDIADRLCEAGLDRSTPAAVVENAALPYQRTVTGSVADIAQRAGEERVQAPALLIIGDVVSMYPQLAWFEKLPLFGRTIAVTRATGRSESMSARLRALGADVLEIPTIAIEPLELSDAERDRLRRVSEYDYLVITSPASVEVFMQRLLELGLDARALATVRVASIGESTSARLRGFGIVADMAPDDYVAESLVESFQKEEDIAGKRILIPRSGKARTALVDGLESIGAAVDTVSTYAPVQADTSRERILDVLDREPDFVTFTSSSTVDNFVRILGEDVFQEQRSRVNAASIGPATTRTLRRFEIDPVVEADPHTVAGLINAMEERIVNG